MLVVTELFLPTKGGTAIWFDEVYRRLGGKENHVVTAAVPGDAEHDRTHPNTIHRVRLGRHPWLRPESLLLYAKLFGKTGRVALSRRFGALHAGRVLPEGLVARLIAWLRGIPCVVYAHGEEITTWRQPAKFRIMRWVFRNADLIVANSAFTRDELLKIGVDGRSIEIVHPGVDIERFHPAPEDGELRRSLGVSAQDHLILSVGRLSRRKGFDQVVKAVRWLSDRNTDVHYAIIGIGEDMGYLAALARELGVVKRVHFLGHVSPDDLPRWLNEADVFAMPNREIEGDTEGFGMVFLEAAACAKPVIAGQAGGTGAAVIDGQTGLRVPGADAEAVARALEALLTDPERARAMGMQGLRRVREEFSWESVAERTRILDSQLRR